MVAAFGPVATRFGMASILIDAIQVAASVLDTFQISWLSCVSWVVRFWCELSPSFVIIAKNDPQKTTELFSFGQPKEEKLKSHHHPQREATAPT
ncbi:hypothetical protein Taro_035700 [Colocasia esculenta]|uniref:Uncharacterized protein n=1 Tax=Colocasia esculenta TaxID=4460 RepID=A0A843VZM0_COLES|nr:hypothetical protein [Colocasia esculenta]